MFFKRELIMVSLLFTACAHRHGGFLGKVSDIVDTPFRHDAPVPERKMDPALEPFLTLFVADAKERGVIITQESIDMLKQIVYVETLSSTEETGVMAVCERFYGEDVSIRGNKKVRWTKIEVQIRGAEDYTEGVSLRLKELMYHELFHCLMNKGHLPDGVPGIMAPTLSKDSERVFTDWKGLVDEMFSEKYINMIPDTK